VQLDLRILPELGGYKLRDITPGVVQRFLAGLTKVGVGLRARWFLKVVPVSSPLRTYAGRSYVAHVEPVDRPATVPLDQEVCDGNDLPG
jgi:hypothetical protein